MWVGNNIPKNTSLFVKTPLNNIFTSSFFNTEASFTVEETTYSIKDLGKFHFYRNPHRSVYGGYAGMVAYFSIGHSHYYSNCSINDEEKSIIPQAIFLLYKDW